MNPWYPITLIGSPEIWIGVCIFLVALYLTLRSSILKNRTRKRKLFKGVVILVVLSFMISFGIIYILKNTLAVPRICTPCPGAGCNPYCPLDTSFPSGHSAIVFVLFTSVLVISRHRWTSLVLLAVALLVSYSRIALGVHTLSDVVGGAALGVLVVILVWWLERHLKLGQITPRID